MKKLNLFVSFCLVMSITSFSQSTDSVLVDYKINGEWQKSALLINHYNMYCQIDSALSQSWEPFSETWINQNLSVSTYNAEGRNDQNTYELYSVSAGQWIAYARDNITYSNGGLHIVIISQNWDNTANTWINALRSTTENDVYGNQLYFSFELYSSGSWQKIVRSANVRNSRHLIQQGLYQFYSNNEWVNSSKYENTYSTSGNTTTSINFNWDVASGKWIPSYRSGNHLTPSAFYSQESISQVYNTSDTQWVNSSRTANAVNKDSLPVSSVQQYWNTSIGKWKNQSENKAVYNRDGSVHYTYFQIWDEAADTALSLQRETYTHHSCSLFVSVTGSEDEESHFPKEIQNVYQQALHPVTTTAKTFVAQLWRDLEKYNMGETAWDIKVQGIGGQNQTTYRVAIKSRNTARGITTEKNITSPLIPVTVKGTFTVSPNPASRTVTLSGTGTKKAGSVFRLYNATGSLVVSRPLTTTGTQKVTLPSLPTGVYTATLTSGKELQTQQLLIE